jgi:hypothetical protein
VKRVFAAVYVLVLATQLPHVYSAYAALESPDLPVAQATAFGAALAFELAIGVFTIRIITGSRSRWTKPGLLFFLVASAVANATYYQLIPLQARWVMAAFATVALPLALALFAEEFGAEVKRAESKAQREQRRLEREQAASEPAPVGYRCGVCGREFATQQGLNGHQRKHKKGV